MTKYSKILTIILWVILGISAVLIASLMANISDNSADPVMGGWINSNIVWAYILMVAGAAIALLAGVFQMASDFGSAKKGLLSLAGFAIVAVIAYLLASDAIPQFYGVEKFIASGTLNAQVAKMIDTGLIVTYLLLGIAILSIVWSSVSQIFK